ncbi:acyltransferase [Acrocarpospora sp. B8E8]|uniref:acyltransferase family protein n=1 Tax=Acrocarpospora sp. B8E8 TaxID=3153572 RepID=UPI00325E4A64
MTRRIDAISGLRALAALGILVFHVAAMTNFTMTGGVPGALVARLDVAVSIFFALSGLLLFRPWAREILLAGPPPAVRGYLWRRALRILPAYWITVVVAMTMLAESTGYTARQWIQMLLLVQVYDPDPGWPNGGLGPTALGQMWSLAVEAAFYLVLPLLAWAARRFIRSGTTDSRAVRLLAALGGLGATSFLYAIFMHVPERVFWIQFLLPHYLVFFALGMAVATVLTWAEADTPGGLRARAARDTAASSAGTLLVTAAAAYWLLMTPVAGRFGDPFTGLRDEELRLLLHTLITLLVVLPVACQPAGPTGVNRVLGSGPMRFLGQVSFGIFLWQFVVMEAVFRATGLPYFGGNFLTVLGLSLLGTVALAAATYYLVERPLLGRPAEPREPARPATPPEPVTEKREISVKPPRRPRQRDVARQDAHQDALDGIRALAALAVLVYHVGGKTGLTEGWGAWAVSRGDVGVAIFFTLSGLLLYRPWARAALDAGNGPETTAYLWRRAFRILPAYWLVAVIAMIFFNSGHNASQWVWAKWLLLLQIYDVGSWWGGTEGRGLEQMWSLSVEVAFYLALPLIAAALAGFARKSTATGTRALALLAGVGALGVISVIWTVVAHQPGMPPEFNMLLPRYFLWFGAGMALAIGSAWAATDERARSFCAVVAGRPALSWAIAALAFAVGSTPLTGPLHLGALPATEGTTKAVLWAVVGLFLVAPSAFSTGRQGLTHLVFGNPVVRYLGRISYGIFLWQFVVIYGYYELTGNEASLGGGFVTVLVVAAAGTLALAALTYHLIEQPFHQLGRAITTDAAPVTRSVSR